MKKTLFLILCVLTSCNESDLMSKNEQNLNYVLQFQDIFSLDGSYYVYLYLDYCVSCASFTPKVEEKAKHSSNLYISTPPEDYVFMYQPGINIGVRNINQIKLNSFPTLLLITNKEITETYSGVTEISNVLF